MGRKPKETDEQKENVKASSAGDKSIDLALAIASIEKDFGKGSVMMLDSFEKQHPIQHISSGSIALDSILGCGGFPFGRIVEITGVEGSGKTSVCLELVARGQQLGLTCAFIDVENSFNAEYAKKIGVDTKKLIISQPDSGNQALAIVGRLVSLGRVDVIILDSLAACAPEAEMAKEMTENPQMGLLPAMLSRFFRTHTAMINKNKCLFVATNQIREKVGVMWGSPLTTPGGRAMKFFATQRLDVKPVEKITAKDGSVIGNRVEVKTIKNKMFGPYKTAQFDIIFGVGVDKSRDLIDIAVQVGVMKKEGASYSYGDQKVAFGIDAARFELSSNVDLFNRIKQDVLNIVGPEWGKEGK